MGRLSCIDPTTTHVELNERTEVERVAVFLAHWRLNQEQSCGE